MSDLPDVSVDDLRRLARGLVFDRHGAEDVVQEAWLAALRAQPATASLGGWLAGAVRNLAGNRRRDEARRAVRERAAARPEGLPSAGEGAARIEVLRRLLDALERLDEPYRAAVMLRYLEDQPPRVIARRLGVPVNTARTHVRRGLERLRLDLDGERGEGRQDCLAALVPFVGGLPWTAALGTGGAGVVLMQKKLVIAGLVLFLLGIAYFVARSSLVDSRAGSAPASIATVDAAPSTAPDAAGASVDPAPPIAAGQREKAAESAALTGSWIVRGHAFRKLGEPFPELPLRGRVYAGTKPEGIPLLEVRLTTDAAGDFAWPLEPPAELVTVHVIPVSDDMKLAAWDVFLPGDPAPERWTVRAMPLDCTVRGRVLDTEGRVVAGAKVCEDGRVEEQETTTDAEGVYALRVAADSERRLRVFAPGFAQARIIVNTEVGEVQAPDALLRPEGRLRGRVLDEEGRPVEGALVEPWHPFGWVSAITSSDGAFELGTLDLEAEYLAVTASKAGYLTASARIELEKRGAPVELRLERGTRLVGRVLGPDGAPVWGAWVSIGDYPWSEPRIEAWSDHDGRYAIEHAATGPQTAWLWRSGFAQLRTEVTIHRDGPEQTLDFQLAEAHFVGGVVLDEGGAPRPWTMVYVQGRPPRGLDKIEGFQAYTGADGRFRFDGLPDLPILIGALAQGRARVELPVPALDRDDLVVRMVRSAGFAGTVVDAVTGAPVPQFVVRVGFPSPEFEEQAVDGYPATWSDGVTFTDPEGRWRLADDFEAGQYAAVTIEAAGYAPAAFDAVRTELDADPAAFLVRLAAGTLVRGRVVERGTGAPLDGVRIRRLTSRQELRSLDNAREPVLETRTDSAGRFELVNVPTGSMSLVVEHPEHALACDGPFEILGAAPVERWIELGSGATVRGRLLDGRGTPLADEIVSITCLEGIERHTEHATRTDGQGGYALTGLTPGLYHVRWERRRGEAKAYDLVRRLELGPEETLELDLRPGGRTTLTGMLEYEGALPETANVLIMPHIQPRKDDPHVKWIERSRGAFAVNGVFEAHDLEPGTYTVVANVLVGLGESVRGSLIVDVPAEGTLDVRIPLERR